jgi:hypothetical protein
VSSALSDAVVQAIVQFELNLATAWQNSLSVGVLDARGAQGGPGYVATQTFYVTINDLLAFLRAL